MEHTLTVRESSYQALRRHFFAGNKLEAAAILLCHTGNSKSSVRLMVQKAVLIPPAECEQSEKHVIWPFASYMQPAQIEEIDRSGLSVITIHNHPDGVECFSRIDDSNDRELFKSVNNWFDDDRTNGSAIMLPNGRIIARKVDCHGQFTLFDAVTVAGSSIRIWKQAGKSKKIAPYATRVAQTFGKGTFDLLRSLKVGVLGCSGTGSILTELLARNCVGHLVIADPDVVELKNLNRIVNSRKADANKSLPKVEVIKESVKQMDMGVSVETYFADTSDKEVIEAFAGCDILFGCVDTATGRYHLEQLATAYFIPYFDVGVYLEADGNGNISQADAVSHYVHPENACLMSRGVYTSEQIRAEYWQANDPAYYKKQRMAGYLAAVGEDQPAVISINMQAACFAFNDFLARLHKFRLDDNSKFNEQRFQHVQGCYLNTTATKSKNFPFNELLGVGDKHPFVRKLKGECTD